MLTSHYVRHLCNLILIGLALLAGDAWATCYPQGGTQSCSRGYCEGISTCDDYWGPCEFTGESTAPCSVCGRSGTRRCDSDGNLLASTCTAYRATDDICNGCDDDGDGQVDEDYVPSGICDPQQNGCFGKYHCINGQRVCRVTVGTQYLSCADNCGGYSAKRWCREDGTVGPCTRDDVAPENCNGCDDDRDGIVDNAPNQGPSTITRNCIGPGGACPGSTETCVNGSWSGVCTAPPEVCNGLDDDCDSSIDEGNVCRADSISCSCTPTTCAVQGRNCGTIPDGCGGALSCGTCGSGQMCNNNVCVGACVPTTCAAQGKNCGTISDGCGGTINCGSCGTNEACSNNTCVSTCVPTTCAARGKNCGTISDGCGGTLNCGSCFPGLDECVTNICVPICPPNETRCCDNSCSVGHFCDVELCPPPGEEM